MRPPWIVRHGLRRAGGIESSIEEWKSSCEQSETRRYVRLSSRWLERHRHGRTTRKRRPGWPFHKTALRFLILCRTRSYIKRFRIVRRPSEGKKGPATRENPRGEHAEKGTPECNSVANHAAFSVAFSRCIRATESALTDDHAANRNNLVYVKAGARLPNCRSRLVWRI